MMHKIFGPFVAGRAALGLLIIRLGFGLGMAIHGYQKLQAPFHWADGMKMGIPPFFQGLATLSEFGGGLAMMAGLLTPLAMLGIICTMGFAIVGAQHGQPYVSLEHKPDFELSGHYLWVALGLLLSGPGTLSLDALLFGRRSTTDYTR